MRTVMVSFVLALPPGGAGVGETGAGACDPGGVLGAGCDVWSLGRLAGVPWSSLQPVSVSAVTMPGTTMAVLPSLDLDRDSLMTLRLRPSARGSVDA